MNRTASAALSAILILAAAGCKKDSAEPPAAATTETAVDATVNMHFNFLAGTAPFTLGSTVVQDSLGHNVLLDQVRFFVSGIQAVDDAGQVLAQYEGTNLLVDAATPDTLFAIGAIHAYHVHAFHFGLGLDAATNATDPATAAPPLNDTSMYFDAMMGHKFLVVTGHADLDGSGAYATPVNYACGMDMLLTGAHAHVHHNLAQGEVFNAQLTVNLALLFKGINLAVDAAPDMDAPASQRMMQNLSLGIDGVE